MNVKGIHRYKPLALLSTQHLGFLEPHEKLKRLCHKGVRGRALSNSRTAYKIKLQICHSGSADSVLRLQLGEIYQQQSDQLCQAQLARFWEGALKDNTNNIHIHH